MRQGYALQKSTMWDQEESEGKRPKIPQDAVGLNCLGGPVHELEALVLPDAPPRTGPATYRSPDQFMVEDHLQL